MSFLEIEEVCVQFRLRDGARARTLRAVDGVTLDVARGETVGIVGESGSGKTTLGRAVLGLAPVAAGAVRFDGEDVRRLSGGRAKPFRRRVQMVFQDPFESLNPRMTVGDALAEVLAVHRLTAPGARRGRVAELLQTVGLSGDHAGRYPHEFSGGQRQRIGIARALAVQPELVIADEPVSALDVSVQVQILQLLRDLRQRLGLTYLLIAHDLAVVHHMCDRVAVMYLGRIVERGPSADVFVRPAHPYTEALLSAVPDIEKGLRSRREGRSRIVLRGDAPSSLARPAGCPFHPRCHRARERCRVDVPALREVLPGRASACHFAEDVYAARRGA